VIFALLITGLEQLYNKQAMETTGDFSCLRDPRGFHMRTVNSPYPSVAFMSALMIAQRQSRFGSDYCSALFL
jgi:hypothetical protein